MLVIFSYFSGDQNLAKKNLKLISNMGNVSTHQILLLVPEGLDVGEELAYCASEFQKAHVCMIPENNTMWPFAANWHFWNAVQIAESAQFRCPYLWMEPDAVALRPSWLNEIEAEYKDCMKPMMGALVKGGEVHMNGVGVWLNVTSNCPSFRTVPIPKNQLDAVSSPHIAFDFGTRHDHMPLCYESKLFQNEYRQENNHTGEGEDRWKFIKRETAVFHSEKTGRLIDFLSAHYGFVK